MNEYLEKYVEATPNQSADWFQMSETDREKWISRRTQAYYARDELTKKFAWAVPTDEALDCIAKYSPIVEIGAGTGYWASLLEQRGVEIHAYDAFPPDGTDFESHKDFPDKSWYHRGALPHTQVRKGNQRKLKGYKAKWNLFLCWPPMSNMAVQALIYHRGQYVIYIGEGYYGCNADDAFFGRLEKFYDEVDSVRIPQWDGLHDYLTVYKRR